jgi:hypothetical protein
MLNNRTEHKSAIMKFSFLIWFGTGHTLSNSTNVPLFLELPVARHLVNGME